MAGRVLDRAAGAVVGAAGIAGDFSPPLDPVLLSTMPLRSAPLAEMLWNVTSAAPMVVLAMLSAVPVPELMVLPAPCTVTVPPPVALKPVPEVVVMSRPLPPPVGVEVDRGAGVAREIDGGVGAGGQRLGLRR